MFKFDLKPADKPRKRTKMIAIYILLLILVLVCMGLLKGCDGGDATDVNKADTTPQKSDTLRIAITYSPMNYYMQGDSVAGLSYELIERMSKELDMPVRYYPVVNMKASIDGLEKGAYDMFVSISPSSALRKKFLFTDDVYTDRLVLIQNVKTPQIKSIIELAGKTVDIEKSSATEERLANASEEMGAQINVRTHEDLSDEYIFLKVAKGEFQYAVINEKTANRLAADNQSVMITAPIGFEQFQSWMLRRSSVKIYDKINKWLEECKTTDFYPVTKSKYDN